MEINGIMLRAMSEELSVLRKEASIDKQAFPAVGKLVQRAGSALAGYGKKHVTRVSGEALKAGPGVHQQVAGVFNKGVNLMGGGAKGVRRMHQAAGALRLAPRVAAGGVAVGAGAYGINKMRQRRQQQRY